MQQMNLIDDHEAYQGQERVTLLPGEDVPLLGCDHKHLGGLYLLFR